MNDCLFCRIIRGEIASRIIYETENVVSFLTIQPVNRGHPLVVHRHHHADIFDTPEADMAELIVAAKIVAEKVKAATGAEGVNIGMNNGAVAGQAIFHAHLHVIPRFPNDGFKHWAHRDATPNALALMADKIRAVK